LQERRQGYSIAAFFQPGSARAAVAHNGHMVNSGSIGPTSVRQTIRFECQRLINPGANPLGARLAGNRLVLATQNAFWAQGARLRCAWTEREGPFGSENYALPKNKGQGYSPAVYMSLEPIFHFAPAARIVFSVATQCRPPHQCASINYRSLMQKEFDLC
jgi:hypothetical protein